MFKSYQSVYRSMIVVVKSHKFSRSLPVLVNRTLHRGSLQEQLLFSARRRARSALEKNSAEELKACSEAKDELGLGKYTQVI